MNYEKQLEAFYSKINYNPVSVIATAVYQSIVYVAHCANRFDDLSIANGRLASLSGGLSVKQLQNARNELINKKYISYKRGSNQNIAPKYSLARISKVVNDKSGQPKGIAEGVAEGTPEGIAEGMAEGYLKTRLDVFFNYLSNSRTDFFEDGSRTINAKDKISIIMNLKRLEIYIDNLEILSLYSEQSLLQAKMFYWIIKEIYFRPSGRYLKNLTNNMLAYKYLKAKQYTNAVEKFDIEKIIAYTIKSIENELIERSEKNGKNNG